MQDKKVFVVENPSLNMGNEGQGPQYKMEVETNETRIASRHNEIAILSSDKDERGSGDVVFSSEAPLVVKDSRKSNRDGGCCSCGAKKLKSRLVPTDSKLGKNEKSGQEKKLCRQDRLELSRLFQGALSSNDWELAENLILLADPQTLNDALCIALDSVWFLSTQQELYGITRLIKKVITNGAYDFTRAALRTSFLASCVSACQSRTMSLADTVTVMAQR